MKRILPGLFVVLLALSACAAPGGPRGSSPGDSPDDGDSGTGGIEHPTGHDEPILIVDSAGGFVPIEFNMTRLPLFVLLGDGRVITHGFQTLQYPGPALPPLQERTLNEAGIQAVLEAIEDTSLFTSDLELRGAQNVIADAADTIFILDAGGNRVTVMIYGLGSFMPGMEPPQGVPSGEIQAHGVLGQLHDQLLMLDTSLPADAWETEGWQPYEPGALRLFVRDVSGEPTESDLPVEVRDWPVDGDPAAFGEEQANFGNGTRCGVVTGEEAASWLADLHAATQISLWSDDGERRFSVAVRPLLPHEAPTCPELDGA